MALAAIDWDKLLELVWAAALSGIVIAAIFATLILGATRASDERRAGNGATAAAYTVLAALAGLAFAAGVAFGISVIVAK
jgi:uncharacterized membrane protein